jgi:succinate dehydrogenase/fumarate reductase-like Fe-S protein
VEKSLAAVEPVTSFKQEKDMREELENIIRNLTEVKEDLDKVEAGSYGYKSAAPRARKALMEASKELREIRTAVQEHKKGHEEK